MTTWTATLWLDDIQPVYHRELGLGRLLAQYRGDQPRLQGALGAFLDGLQSIEDVAFEVLVGRWPLTAVGVQLDNLGGIVGQLRGDLTDDEYRVFILGRIFVNKATGTIPDFVELLPILGCGPSELRDMYPAALEVSATECDYPDQVWELLHTMKAAGVQLHFLHSAYLENELFTTSSTLGADELDAARGLRSLPGVLPVTGGRFMDLVTS